MGETEDLLHELVDALKNALGAYAFYSPPLYPWEERARATLARAEAALSSNPERAPLVEGDG